MIKNIDRKIKILRFIGLLLIMSIVLTMPVFADANYGENAGKWALDQIFWGALVVVVVVILGCLLKRNFTLMGISIVVAAIALTIIDDPTRLKTMGEAIWGAITGGGGGA